MNSEIPQWADVTWSAQLASIRLAGEGQLVEFKERIPEQKHRLARELAAFGTSGGGTVFIGISDSGELVEIEAADGEERDDLAERVHGIVSTIQPVLVSDILFAVENGNTVLVIRIPPQEEPVFYYEHRPYIRDLRRSRPATPDEVKEAVWAHHSSEFQRQAERIKLEQMQNGVDSGKRFSKLMAKERELSTQRHGQS